MYADDRVRLLHMLDAAREAVGVSAGLSRESLASDRLLALALVKDIEIIGEAAAHVTEPSRASLPNIPWRDVIAMRNRLIHAYFDVDIDLVWTTLIVDLPPLIRALERAVHCWPHGQEP
jgi:uncharacterized protein with HEPN domain